MPSMRGLVRWALPSAVVSVLLAYGTIIGYMMSREVALVFQPNTLQHVVAADLQLSTERITFSGSRSEPRLLWAMRLAARPDAPWVIFLHGNSANISTPENVTRAHQLRLLGLQVLAVEYPGFGALDGVPSERSAAAAAEDAWRWLRESAGVPARRIAIYGWSLGSGVATHLASTADEAALVLEGAFTGVDDRASEEYPWLPVRWMLNNPFASRDRIAQAGSPLLLLHARDDEVIPFAHAERLLSAARGSRQLVPLSGGHIVPNLAAEDDYLSALHTFLGQAFETTLSAPPRSLAAPLGQAQGTSARRGLLTMARQVMAAQDPRYNRASYALLHAAERWREADPALALELATLNASAHPDVAAVHTALGRLREITGDDAGATEAYERAEALLRR